MKIDILHIRASQLAAILSAPLGAAGNDWLSADQRERYEAELENLKAEIEARDHAKQKGNANG